MNAIRVSKMTAVAAALALGVGAAATAGVMHLEAAANVASGRYVTPLADDAVQPLLALDRAMEAVAERVNPTVVNITVSEVARQSRQQIPGDDGSMQSIPGLPPGFFGQFFGQMPQMPQRPQAEMAVGSGVIVSPDGYIVTNNHVVDGATTLQVTLFDQRRFTAKVVGTDKATDLAVVKINASGLPSATWGDSGMLKPGQTVLAFGDPLQMDFSVTRGIVSALNRSRTMGDGPDARGSFIQTDAAINPGNSGGPLVNARGEVIGIDTEMLSESGGSSGIGFAIPSNVVRPTVDELIKNGKVVRGYLGVTVADLSPDEAQSLAAAGDKGALVQSVNADSPAEHAGLKVYDIVTAVDGEKITGSNDLQTIIGAHAPGTVVKLGVVRDGQLQTVSATLGNLDEAGSSTRAALGNGENGGNEGGSSAAPKLGVTAAPLSAGLRSQFRLPAGVQGVAVTDVDPGSPAAMAGIGSGDVIEQVNKHAVSTPEELRTQLGQAGTGNAVLLLVWHAGSTHIAAVQLP